jgi:peptidyl-prolyl cis-trans isomerase SurA
MGFVRSIGAVVFFVVIFITGTPTMAAEICNRVVAFVNDDVVTLHELNKKIKEITGQTPLDLKLQDEGNYVETRRQVLDLLIDTKISEDKIREMGITITEKMIDETIEKIKGDNHWTQEDLTYFLDRSGLNYDQYRVKVKKDLERFQLINFEVKSKIIIREEMINQYYEKHRDDFSSHGSVHLAGIFLARKNPKDEQELSELSERAEAILAELKEGKNFGELVEKYSDGPGADEGGDLGVFKSSQLEPELGRIMKTIPEGGFSDPIIRPQGIQIIKLIRREEGKVKTLEQVRDAVYGILYQDEVNKRYLTWIKELRESSYTKIVF